jgi:sec-independent protein translocase protein TatA
MFGISGSEWIFILLIVLVLFGGKRIPELAKGLGKGIAEFKKGVRDVETEMEQSAQSQPAPQQPPVTQASAEPFRFDPQTGKPLDKAAEPMFDPYTGKPVTKQ